MSKYNDADIIVWNGIITMYQVIKDFLHKDTGLVKYTNRGLRLASENEVELYKSKR